VGKVIEITKHTPKELAAADLIYRRLHQSRYSDQKILMFPMADWILVNNTCEKIANLNQEEREENKFRLSRFHPPSYLS
jgi:hypothetical protein